REKGCSCFAITAEKLDEAVWSKVMDVLTNPSYVEQYMRQWLEGEDKTAAELQLVEAELVAIETKIRRMSGLLGSLDDPQPAVQVLNDLTARKRTLLLQESSLRQRRAVYETTLERWDTMVKRWRWQGTVDHPELGTTDYAERWQSFGDYSKLSTMSYAQKRWWLSNLNVKAEVWREGDGPDGQRFRITMAIDESFWLPSQDELSGSWIDDLEELEKEHPTTYHTTRHVPDGSRLGGFVGRGRRDWQGGRRPYGRSDGHPDAKPDRPGTPSPLSRRHPR
ncbi:MAG: site-specific recombinase, partial [Thermomicrobiales bacterium]|nr:site-specific recombinase [Thermomicrobiales bacterium]